MIERVAIEAAVPRAVLWVLPFDIVAAVLAVSALVPGARKRAAVMHHAHP